MIAVTCPLKKQFIFSIFAANEQKLLIFAQSALRKCYICYILKEFAAKNYRYFKSTPNLHSFSVKQNTQGNTQGKNSSIRALGKETKAF